MSKLRLWPISASPTPNAVLPPPPEPPKRRISASDFHASYCGPREGTKAIVSLKSLMVLASFLSLVAGSFPNLLRRSSTISGVPCTFAAYVLDAVIRSQDVIDIEGLRTAGDFREGTN